MIIISKDLFNRITEHSKKEYPNEACGILAGRLGKVESVYEMTNVDKSPSNFFMDSKEQLKVMKEIRNLGLDFMGIYHSHVASEAYPSKRDVELAFYAEASYAIITIQDRNNPRIRSFRIVEGNITEEKVEIVDDL
jgi:proteasome lid subunit RPN8/RPN11